LELSYRQWLSLVRCNHLPIYSILGTSLLQFLIISILSSSLAFAETQQRQQGQQQQQTGVPVTLIPSITQNILTIVSFLIGTSSFILGLRIQNLARQTQQPQPSSTLLPLSIMNKYFELLILALVIPSIIIIIYGILLVGSVLDPGDVAYLLLLFALFIPAGAVLFLLKKLHMISSNKERT
jgi:hypothetical protein